MSGTITDRFHSLFIFQITIFSLCVLLEEVVVSDKHAHSGTAESSYCTWAASLAKALSQSLLVSYREIQSGESAPVLCADDWHMEQNGQYLVWWNQRNVKKNTLKSPCMQVNFFRTNTLSSIAWTKRVMLFKIQEVKLRLHILWS